MFIVNQRKGYKNENWPASVRGVNSPEMCPNLKYWKKGLQVSLYIDFSSRHPNFLLSSRIDGNPFVVNGYIYVKTLNTYK